MSVDPHDLLDELMARVTTGGANSHDDSKHQLGHAEEVLAQRFTAEYGDMTKYVSLWGQWLIWDGARWRTDNTLEVYDFARAIARQAAAEVCSAGGSVRRAAAIASARTVQAIVTLARAAREHAALPDDWDTDQFLLATPGGTVDLRTGQVRDPARDDRITKSTSVAPGGDCPLWHKFLQRIFDGDAELIAYIKRVLGYSLTGSVREHALFFFYGTGGNGKSVLLNTWQQILGDYARTAPMETFTASSSDRHPTELAMLRGARTVIAQETNEGQRWAEAKIKALTGGDTITARFMRQDFFSFSPVFKLLIAGNHKPSLRNVEEAVRRRIHLVPFTVTIPPSERDPELQAKLAAEAPGILQWAIEGCLEWQQVGLAPPKAVLAATGDYLADEDAIGRFIAERCINVDTGVEELQTLFSAWRDWCESTGEFAGTRRRFGQALEARGFVRDLHPTTRRATFRGIRLAVG